VRALAAAAASKEGRAPLKCIQQRPPRQMDTGDAGRIVAHGKQGVQTGAQVFVIGGLQVEPDHSTSGWFRESRSEQRFLADGLHGWWARSSQEARILSEVLEDCHRG